MPASAEPYIYADNAATTPLSPAALQAMMPFLTSTFGNPSGIHRVAREAADALADARARIATCLGAGAPNDIFFTSGGSESDTWVLHGAVQRFRDQFGTGARARVVTSAIEHHAILHGCDELERAGVEIVRLPVDTEGFVAPADLRRALRDASAADHAAGVDAPPAALVSIMLANNEVGAVQDIAQLAAIAHEFDVPFHTDAVQAVGHIPVDARALGAAGMAAALEEACAGLEPRAARVTALRDAFIQVILDACENVQLTGPAPSGHRLPSIASFVCRDCDSELLVMLLDRAGVAAAAGSACATGSTEPSHVITALGIADPAWAHGSVRFSLADDVSAADVDLLLERVPACIRRARLISSMR